MADQVAGLEARGIVACVAINGLLSLPERADALDRVRLGDAGIMKTGHPIRIDCARAKGPAGGDWHELDPLAWGRVQILPAQRDPMEQAQAVMTELPRLAELAPGWDWSRCAVIAREWKYLEPLLWFNPMLGDEAGRKR